MTMISQEDFIQSIADGFQFIAYYHPVDFIKAMGEAYEREQSPAAKNAIAQILMNSRMSAEGHRPVCQDTGIAVVFLKIGMDVRWDAKMSVADMVNEGVRRAYTDKDNPLRASMLADPAGARKNTRDNTPAVIHMEVVPGDKVEVKLAAKGGGSENKSRFAVLNPSDSVVDWILQQVPTMGGDWCPPGMLGIGIGGTAEKAMVLAKESLMGHLDIHELKARGPKPGPRSCGSRSSTRSTSSVSAPRDSAGSPPCSTSRCSTTRPTPRPCPWRCPQLRRDPPRRIPARRQRTRPHRPARPRALAQARRSISPPARSASNLETLTKAETAPGRRATGCC